MGSVGPVAGDRLRALVERIERMNEEIAAMNGDKREIYAEAKGAGFCVKTLKKVVQARTLDKAERQEQDALFETYMRAIEGGSAPTRSAGTVSANKPRARAGAREVARSAVKVFVDSVANRPGESVTIATPDGKGVRIENSDGKKWVSAVDGNSGCTEERAGGVGDGSNGASPSDVAAPAVPEKSEASFRTLEPRELAAAQGFSDNDSAQRQGGADDGREPVAVSADPTSAEPPSGGHDSRAERSEGSAPAARGSDSKKDGEDLLDIPACLRRTTLDKPRAASLFEQVTGVRVQNRPVVTKAADGREELQPFG